MKLRFIAAWYDLWVGAYYNRKTSTLYLLPVPRLGIAITFKRPSPNKCVSCGRKRHEHGGDSGLLCPVRQVPFTPRCHASS